jgi:hypothetical protein
LAAGGPSSAKEFAVRSVIVRNNIFGQILITSPW